MAHSGGKNGNIKFLLNLDQKKILSNFDFDEKNHMLSD